MRKTRVLCVRVVLVASCLSVACGPRSAFEVAGEKGRSAAATLAVRELGLRYVIADTKGDDRAFVAFGNTPDERSDPPAAFIDRLSDAGVALVPASAMGEGATTQPLLVVHDVRWESDTQAVVSVTRVRLGVGALDGFTARVAWSDGVWRIEKSTASWST